MAKKFDILIIDDEQVVVDSVVKLCSSEGLKVDYALDVAGALNKLSRDSYRLLVCDIMLPDKSGFDFQQVLITRHIKTPLVMTSGFSTVENAVKSLYHGAIDFLPKPFTVDELLSVVYRGLKYAEIYESLVQSPAGSAEVATNALAHVPCPAKYYRLNYSGWVNLEFDGSATIGVTDLFLKTIHSITKINLANIDEEIIQGYTCAHFETNDTLTHQFLSPITGRILKRNEKLIENISLIEKDPYFSGWLYTVVPSNLEYELKHLSSCSSDRF